MDYDGFPAWDGLPPTCHFRPPIKRREIGLAVHLVEARAMNDKMKKRGVNMHMEAELEGLGILEDYNPEAMLRLDIDEVCVYVYGVAHSDVPMEKMIELGQLGVDMVDEDEGDGKTWKLDLRGRASRVLADVDRSWAKLEKEFKKWANQVEFSVGEMEKFAGEMADPPPAED